MGCKEVAAKKWQQRRGSKEVAAKKWQQRSVSKEVSAKKCQQRSVSKEVSAKNITDITDPTPAPPLEGRGWLRIELCGGQGDSYCTI